MSRATERATGAIARAWVTLHIGEFPSAARVAAGATISTGYNVPACRAFCPRALLLRFNSETNLAQRQFVFLHFPKAWWEASGWPHASHGVARCDFRFWLRACFFSFSAIRTL